MADLHFELVTPDRLVMSDDVYMVVVPGTEGESGIMAGHAPYMTTLKNGEIAVYRSQAGQPERIPVTGGFAEVSDRGLTVLAESAGAVERDRHRALRPVSAARWLCGVVSPVVSISARWSLRCVRRRSASSIIDSSRPTF